MEITAKHAKHLTNIVNEVNENIKRCEFYWIPIISAIKRGSNFAIMIMSCQAEIDFVENLKKLGYKVKIEEKRFYNEAIIEW